MGRWLKTRLLGRGSYGTVHEAISTAEQKDLPKPIAIKSASLSKSYTLQKEAQVLESFISVPEILQCHGSEVTVEDNGESFFNLLLECAPHGTLANLINKEPFLDTNKSTKVDIRMLLRGLSCLHRQGFVHCDLKPENTLVFPPNPPDGDRDRDRDSTCYYQLKIADFGLARTPDEKLDRERWKSRFRGTPIYMSPESLACGPIEPPLDIWSFGCVVIEMISGHPAWRSEEIANRRDVLTKVGLRKEAPRMPRGLSRGCIDFLDKCFARDPTERWSADMLLNHPYLL